MILVVLKSLKQTYLEQLMIFVVLKSLKQTYPEQLKKFATFHYQQELIKALDFATKKDLHKEKQIVLTLLDEADPE